VFGVEWVQLLVAYERTRPAVVSVRAVHVLVTGSAGFIGSHVVEALRERGHDVSTLDQRSREDVRDETTVACCLAGVDAVCHQAAKVGLGVDVLDLPSYASANALGTAVLLAGMPRAGVNRLVLASSMVVYGEGAYDCPAHGRVKPGPRAVADLAAGRFEPRCPFCDAALTPGTVGEDASPDPRNGYADTKLAQEHLAASWARMTGDRVALPQRHYGPRMPRDTPYAGVAAIFRTRLERGRPPRVFEDGGQRRDFVHVRDVARANVLALESAAAHTPVRVSCGRTTSPAANRTRSGRWQPRWPRRMADPIRS
jgi:dTDP-L-rhamnose 4-epimerase